MLLQYGCSDVAVGWRRTEIYVAFHLQHVAIIFRVPLPALTDDLIAMDEDGNVRGTQARLKEMLRYRALRWRDLKQVIRSKLQSVDIGIETVEQAFMAQLLLRSGQTMSEWVAVAERGETLPQLAPQGREIEV